MTKDKLLDIIHGYKRNEISWDSVLTAVEAYSSASNNGKPIVSGSLPISGDEKLAIAWKTLEWVGFRKGIEFEDEDVLEMLGGNDR